MLILKHLYEFFIHSLIVNIEKCVMNVVFTIITIVWYVPYLKISN